MVLKKWLTLVAVTGLSGFITSLGAMACTGIAESAGDADGGPDATAVASRRAATAKTQAPSSECPISLDFQEAEVDKALHGSWKPPVQTVGACTAEELGRFGKNLRAADESTPIFDVAKGLGASCTSCLFSTTADANWQLVVAVAGSEAGEAAKAGEAGEAGKAEYGFINFGACHGVLNRSDSCGRRYQYDRFCAITACAKCAESREGACLDAVWSKGGACEALLTAVRTSCPFLDESERKCTSGALGHAAVLCGPKEPTSKDAGSDGGDASDAS